MPGTRKKSGRPPLHPGPTELNRQIAAARAARAREEIKHLRIRIPENESAPARGNRGTPRLKKPTGNKTPPEPSPIPSPVYRASGPNNNAPSPPLKSRFFGGRYTRRKTTRRRA